MFIDTAKIQLKAGNGGNGAVSFHREKFVAAGGPDGGDGGRGGSIILVVDDNLTTLADFRYKRKYRAPDGDNGGMQKCSGRKGEDLVIRLPRGTVIKDAETDRLIVDLSDDAPYVLLKGGKGGAGNQHFATSTRQCPHFAKAGVPGEELTIMLELKLLADVGLIGFPNVGKSTLISRLSQAKPKIADYPFTTLTPVLGIVRVGEERSFVMADIPGIIEGASDGVGLGHEFLRHVERCRLLIHVVDVSGSEDRDPKNDFMILNEELKKYSSILAGLPQIVAPNKTDLSIPEQTEDFVNFVKEKGFKVIPISGVTGDGLRPLLELIWKELEKLPPVRKYESEPEPIPDVPVDKQAFTIRNEEGVFIIEAPWLLRILKVVNMDDYESLQYFQRVLRSCGIIDELERMGVAEGDTVSIYDLEFEYVR